VSLLVIFGAGASYDSINPRAFPDKQPTRRIAQIAHFRPPLARELFEDRGNFNLAVASYPQAQGRIMELRLKTVSAADFNVERELEQIKQSAGGYPPVLVELAAIQFYLRRIIGECGGNWQAESHGLTNYRWLLSRIDRWRYPDKKVILVTFNYDYMLEMSLQGVTEPMVFNKIREYIARDDLKVIRPHGSVTWGQYFQERATPEASEQYIIEHAADLHLTDEFVVTSAQAVGDRLVSPALAIPVEGKSDFACPPDHITALVDGMQDVTHVLIVGWRASESRFLDQLKEGGLADKRILVVANDQKEAEKTKQNLLTTGSIKYPDFVTCSSRPGFSAFLEDDDLENFLRS